MAEESLSYAPFMERSAVVWTMVPILARLVLLLMKPGEVFL